MPQFTLLLLGLVLAFGGCGGVPDTFDGEAAMALIEEQVAMGPRVPGTEAHARALAWMTEKLEATADNVITHAFEQPNPYVEGETLHLTNLHAQFRPEATRRLALAAHWDCRPMADQEAGPDSTQAVPGANDAASGVAVLLILAEMMAEYPPPLGIDLLFFDGEDFGREGDLDNYLLGSKRFVEDFPDYRPLGLILLDMVADKDLNIPMEGLSLENAPLLTRRVFAVAAALELPAFQPVRGERTYDDHVPFLLKGIPAVDLIDRDYPAWHTTRDLPDQCSAESLEQVGRLMLALIFEEFAPSGR